MHHQQSTLSRRRMLALSTGVILAGGLGSTAIAGTARADVPTSPRFDLTVASSRLFWKKPLHEKPIMQCFAFDNVNGEVYVMQRSDQPDSKRRGHLAINRMTLEGDYISRMYLNGFGHGIAFGVQPTPDGVIMWTEADAQPYGDDNSRARVVCRFPWAASTTPITRDDVELYEPIDGMHLASCSLDMDHNTIAVRYTKDGVDGMRVSLYDLDAFAEHDFSQRLADISTRPVHTPDVTPQGYQHYGQHLYLLQGNPYDQPCDQPGERGRGNTVIGRINFNDESDHEAHLTNAGYSLNFREPEGLGLINLADGRPRLAMGFASGCPGTRQANIYYKQDPPG
ncbi:MAG TPA: hypothetical protein H9881_12190 [Candidatus Stackebrandtia excrementipullorum]|nr:hypothetical protein [Candidatus Stackebrandtia excrementipullorum]